MAEIRTLKLNLLADVDQFGRGLTTAKGQMSGFDKTVNKISKRAAAAFAAVAASAGYMAIRIGKESVEAAIADEQSQKTLAKALQNTAGATDAVIASTEDWISAQQKSYGISDNKLRPALATLARVTGDVGKAQKLASLAMDISASTGKDLETVSLALAKAHEGNIGALKRLGVPLDDNIVKTKDFDAATEQLAKLFGGAAAANAETYAGKMAIISERTGELKESVGTLLLPAVGKFVDYANQHILPALEDMAAGFAGDKSADSAAYDLGVSIRALTDSFGKLFDALTSGKQGDAESNLESLARALNSVASAINAVGDAVNWMNKQWGKIPDSIKPFLSPALNAFKKVSGVRAAGGSVIGGQAYRVGEFGPEMFVPNGSGSIRKTSGNGSVNITINGAVDPQGTAKALEKLFQDAARRSGSLSFAGATL